MAMGGRVGAAVRHWTRKYLRGLSRLMNGEGKGHQGKSQETFGSFKPGVLENDVNRSRIRDIRSE